MPYRSFSVAMRERTRGTFCGCASRGAAMSSKMAARTPGSVDHFCPGETLPPAVVTDFEKPSMRLRVRIR